MKIPRALLLFLLLSPSLVTASLTVTNDAASPDFQPAQPVIPAKTVNVRDQGAVGDGTANDTSALQKSIDSVVASGGGRVLVPAGNYLTFPLKLGSGLDLHLEKGATLLLADDRKTYPLPDKRYQDAFTATDVHDLRISGEGAIDGQGASWWAEFEANKSMPHRPNLVVLKKCQRVAIEGVTLRNSPMFHLILNDATDATIRGITITAPSNAHNTDGIDPSGSNILITACKIDTGDDDIAIKPGKTKSNKNIRVSNCAFLRGHGLSVGSGTSGGLEHLRVSDCTFEGTDAGIRIKTSRGAGGLLRDAVYENLTMKGVKYAVRITDWYPENTAPKDPSTEAPQPLGPLTPLNREITIRNLTATGCKNAGIIRGLPEAPVTDLQFDHVSISAEKGLFLFFAKDIRFKDSRITAEKGPAVTAFASTVTGAETVPYKK